MTMSLAVTPRFYKQFLLAKNPVAFCNEVRAKFGDLVLARGFFDFYLINNFDADDLIAGVSVYPRRGIQMRIERRAHTRQRAA